MLCTVKPCSLATLSPHLTLYFLFFFLFYFLFFFFLLPSPLPFFSPPILVTSASISRDVSVPLILAQFGIKPIESVTHDVDHLLFQCFAPAAERLYLEKTADFAAFGDCHHKNEGRGRKCCSPLLPRFKGTFAALLRSLPRGFFSLSCNCALRLQREEDTTWHKQH